MYMTPDFNAESACSGGRGLTQGEIALARGIFGNSIDYSKVRIHDSTYIPAGLQGRNIITPNGELYCGINYCDDFSQQNGDYQNLFIHEMAHVWQYQNNILDPRAAAAKTLVENWGNYSNAYTYTPDPSKTLTDYNLEQQADMIADYFAARQKPASQRTQEDADREKVMQKFIENPRYARQLSWRDTFLITGVQLLRAVPGLPM